MRNSILDMGKLKLCRNEKQILVLNLKKDIYAVSVKENILK